MVKLFFFCFTSAVLWYSPGVSGFATVRTRPLAVARSHAFSPCTPCERRQNNASVASLNRKPPPSSSSILFSPGGDQDAEKKSTTEPFIRPATHNSPFVRSLAILYTLLFAIYRTSIGGSGAVLPVRNVLRISPKVSATLHLLSFATWFGTVFYTTFIAGITMFKNLPRRSFGQLQSKLFPKYFQLCATMVGVQMLTLTSMPDILCKSSELALGTSFLFTLLNLLYLEPKSSRVMFDRYALEDEGKRDSEEYKKLASSFGKLHGISSLTNLMALCGAIVHGVRLASGLVPVL